jgi:hypothetical protein
MIMPINTYRKGWHKADDWIAIFIQSPTAEMVQAPERSPAASPTW